MKKTIVVMSAFGLSPLSHSFVWYDNGSVINGLNGLNQLSIISTPNQTFGYEASASTNTRLADNFESGTGWSTNQFAFYAYQTGSTAFSFASANIELRQGGSLNSAQSLWSYQGLPVHQNGGIVGYRVDSSSLSNTSRPIYRLQAKFPFFQLANQTKFWVIFSISGLNGTSVLVPQVMNGPQPSIGNAHSSSLGGPFLPVSWGDNPSHTAEIPFAVELSIPEPTTCITLALALSGTMIRSKRRVAFSKVD